MTSGDDVGHAFQVDRNKGFHGITDTDSVRNALKRFVREFDNGFEGLGKVLYCWFLEV